MKRKYAYITILIAAACLMMGLVAFGMKGAKEVNTTEAQTEPATEPSTEAPTEQPTEAPTEVPTEPSTEAPTEPATEAPTEPEIEIAIKARDTMLEGTPVEFEVVNVNAVGLFSYEKLQQTKMTALIKDGSEYDYKRAFNIFVARSIEEFKSHFSASSADKHQRIEKYIEKYNESYFKKNVVIILYQGGGRRDCKERSRIVYRRFDEIE